LPRCALVTKTVLLSVASPVSARIGMNGFEMKRHC
jgi:hypothetical protein